MLVPTVQMIFRRSLQNVRSRESYLSGDAHPAAFEGFQINAARMVSLANSIRADALPAEVRIRVVEEDPGREGIDWFGQGLTEQLFDTPAAVARVWRSQVGRRSMVVSAEDSRDVNGRPLTFTWALLQGDPAKVLIEPLDGGRRARITLDWHDPFEISEEVPLVTSRVDIGVFAANGVHDSAPAILSWYFPPDASRTWETGPGRRPPPRRHRPPPAGPALRRSRALPRRGLGGPPRLGSRRTARRLDPAPGGPPGGGVRRRRPPDPLPSPGRVTRADGAGRPRHPPRRRRPLCSRGTGRGPE